MEPEIALLAAGVETDVDGAGLNLLGPSAVAEVTDRHPRRDFKRQALLTFAAGFKDRPATTFGNITADVLAHFSPDYERTGFVDVVMGSDWPD